MKGWQPFLLWGTEAKMAADICCEMAGTAIVAWPLVHPPPIHMWSCWDTGIPRMYGHGGKVSFQKNLNGSKMYNQDSIHIFIHWK